jgi:hypothetical protein
MSGVPGSGVPLPAVLRRFADAEGRLAAWPARRKFQLEALAWLASHFEPGVVLHERAVNERLNRLHTFGDWALLRRALFDFGFLDRAPDGTRYWRPLPGEDVSASD